MPKFSNKSLDRLETCDKRLQKICYEVIKIYDFSVLQGYRGEQEQNSLYQQGKSKLMYPESKHNKDPSLAVDIAPYPIDFEDLKRFYYLAGLMHGAALTLGYKIRWGGDWDNDKDFNDQNFNDLAHFEIIE